MFLFIIVLLDFSELLNIIIIIIMLNNKLYIVKQCLWFEVKFTTDDSNPIHIIITTR
jgi:hypothetical protein